MLMTKLKKLFYIVGIYLSGFVTMIQIDSIRFGVHHYDGGYFKLFVAILLFIVFSSVLIFSSDKRSK